jgi:prophage regulatory protein
MAERFLTLKEVLARTSLSRSQTYRLMAEGSFPASVSLGSRVAWVESEIESWLEARIAARVPA